MELLRKEAPYKNGIQNNLKIEVVSTSSSSMHVCLTTRDAEADENRRKIWPFFCHSHLGPLLLELTHLLHFR